MVLALAVEVVAIEGAETGVEGAGTNLVTGMASLISRDCVTGCFNSVGFLSGLTSLRAGLGLGGSFFFNWR